MIPKIHHFETLASTMVEAKAMAVAGAPEGTIVQADQQTSGRGRRGNTWTSPAGNLYMTIVLRPKKTLQETAQLSFAAALALADTIERDDITLKWPNDVLAGGKKIAGILLETESGQEPHPEFLLIGIGVNVGNAPEGCEAIGGDDVNGVRDAIFENLSHWYKRWQEKGFSDIRVAWLARAHGLNAPITARLSEGNVQGIFEGIDPDGQLILRLRDGKSRLINSGAVHFAP